MQHYTNSVIAFNGDRVANATITVTDLSGNAVTIYQDYAGTTPVASVTTNNNGEFDFYVPAGRYNISAAGTGITGYTISDEFIGIADSSVSPFIQSGTGAVSRTSQDKMRETVSVKDFGAVGDGVTDDTAAFNAAIAYANIKTNGLVIYIPAGVYVISSQPTTITKCVTIEGDGQITTRLLFKSCGGLKFDLSAESLVNCQIKNISVLTNSNGYTGISFKGSILAGPNLNFLIISNVNVASNIYIDTTPIAAEWATCIYIENSRQVTIDSVYIQGSLLNQSYAANATSIGIQFNTCMATRVINSNIYFVGDGILVNGQSESCLCSENLIVSVMRGIVFESLVSPKNHQTITDSHIAAIVKGIYIQTSVDSPEACFISNVFVMEFNCIATKPQWTGFDLGFRWSSISNCTIQSNLSLTPTRIGINIDANANTISNITFYNMTTLFNINNVSSGRVVSAANFTSITPYTNLSTGLTTSLITDLVESTGNKTITLPSFTINGFSGSQSKLILADTGSGNTLGSILTMSNVPLTLGVSNSEKFRIDINGNAQLGATSAYNATQDRFTITKFQNEITRLVIDNQSGGVSAKSSLGLYTAGAGWEVSTGSTANNSNALTFSNGTTRVLISSSGNVAIGTISPDASAILDVQSTTKGVRFPNMTTAQKNAITTPAAGLVIFDTTLAKLCVYSGSAWQTITSV